MINWSDTNLLFADGRPILNASVSTVSEGMAMVGAFENGILKCTPGTGSTSDSFLGIAMGPPKPFSTNSKIENIVVPATSPYTVLLTETATSSLGAYQVGGTQVTVSTSAASSSNIQSSTDSVTGLTLLTFNSTFAGASFSVAYSYTMSAVEQASLFGSPYPGFSAEESLSAMQIFMLGRIAVTNWSPTANWYGGTGLPTVKVIAGGLFTDSSNAATGIVPTNVRVLYLPTAANPYLGLELR